MFARYISCCHSFACLSSFSTCKIETLQSPLIWFHELIIAVLSWKYNNSHPALNADNSLPLCYTIYTLLKENSSCQKRNLREMSRGVKLPLVPSHYNQPHTIQHSPDIRVYNNYASHPLAQNSKFFCRYDQPCPHRPDTPLSAPFSQTSPTQKNISPSQKSETFQSLRCTTSYLLVWSIFTKNLLRFYNKI